MADSRQTSAREELASEYRDAGRNSQPEREERNSFVLTRVSIRRSEDHFRTNDGVEVEEAKETEEVEEVESEGSKGGKGSRGGK